MGLVSDANDLGMSVHTIVQELLEFVFLNCDVVTWFDAKRSAAGVQRAVQRSVLQIRAAVLEHVTDLIVYQLVY